MHAPGESSAAAARDRDLRAMVADGVAFSAMVGLGETYVPAFALAIGFGDVVAGLLATLPMLAGACLQLVTPWAVRHLRSYRRWVVWCAALQALSFLPLVAGGLAGELRLVWVALATTAYWAFGMATGPAWNAWVTSLVPPERRARFFARRTRKAQLALLVGILVAGIALEAGRERGAELSVFAALFAAALCARLVSAGFLARQSEAPGLAAHHRALGPRGVAERLRATHATRLLAYLLCMQLAVNVASPFFTPYMLGPLGLDYERFMALTAASFASRIAVLPLLGRLGHGRGARAVLWVGAAGIVPLPSLWLVSHEFAYLFVLQLFAGAAWAAVELATLLSFFEGIEERDRTSILSAFNLASALAIAAGALVGSRIFAWSGGGEAAYAALFVTSSAGRLATLLLLRGLRTPARLPEDVQLRTLAVRPSLGALQRPILATVHDPEEPRPTDPRA